MFDASNRSWKPVPLKAILTLRIKRHDAIMEFGANYILANVGNMIAIGSSFLLISPDMPETSSGSQFPELPVSCSAMYLGCRRSPVVGTPPIHMEQKEPNHTPNLYDKNLRCITSRLGDHLQWSTDQRSMVQTLHINCWQPY